MQEKISKITQVVIVVSACTLGYVSRVLFEFSSTFVGPIAKAYSVEMIRHGIPIGITVLSFLYLQLNPKMKSWFHSVVLEVDKVVWPTKKDTLSMTIVVCIILMISGVILGLFDLTAGTVLQYLLN